VALIISFSGTRALPAMRIRHRFWHHTTAGPQLTFVFLLYYLITFIPYGSFPTFTIPFHFCGTPEARTLFLCFKMLPLPLNVFVVLQVLSVRFLHRRGSQTAKHLCLPAGWPLVADNPLFTRDLPLTPGEFPCPRLASFSYPRRRAFSSV